MDIIHKVFVSSTYEDLREERAAVERTLLQLQCFPVGMEIFPAADDTAWDFIKSQIDDSDYYVLIMAARYGSIEPTTGKSYTEMEYDHAVEKGVPILAFVHGDPGSIHDDKRDKNPAAKPLFEAFRAKVQKRLCRHWTSAKELQAEVATTLTSARGRYKREGFVRASLAVDHKKMADLLERNRLLEYELNSARNERPRAHFAQGDDIVKLSLVTTATGTDIGTMKQIKGIEVDDWEEHGFYIKIPYTWNNVLEILGDDLMRGCTQSDIESRILTDCEIALIQAMSKSEINQGNNFETNLHPTSWITVERQFRFLGWMKSSKQSIETAFGFQHTVEYSITEEGLLAFGELVAAKRL